MDHPKIEKGTLRRVTTEFQLELMKKLQKNIR